MQRAQPRVVVVTRKSALELLQAQFGTVEQTKFMMRARNQSADAQQEAHLRFRDGLETVLRELPPECRLARVDRDDLPRFLFAPDDIVLVVGQDGLVANVAKYLDGQPCIGINPDPNRYDGVLCSLPPQATGAVLRWVGERRDARFTIRPRVMAEVVRDDGEMLLALNEVFIGHRSHQSARYVLRQGQRQERQSSSGLICSTGTGSTGWARSIAQQRSMDHHMPAPVEPRLVWFVREPFPSVVTGTAMDHGAVEKGDELVVVSEMGEGGVVFADGIEHDAIPFLDGRTVTVRVSSRLLRLVGGRGEGTANPTAAGSGVLGGHGGRGGKRRGHPER